jgi:hypothetical protein
MQRGICMSSPKCICYSLQRVVQNRYRAPHPYHWRHLFTPSQWHTSSSTSSQRQLGSAVVSAPLSFSSPLCLWSSLYLHAHRCDLEVASSLASWCMTTRWSPPLLISAHGASVRWWPMVVAPSRMPCLSPPSRGMRTLRASRSGPTLLSGEFSGHGRRHEGVHRADVEHTAWQ